MSAVHFENGKQAVRNWNRVFKAVAAEPRRQLLVSLLDGPADQSVPLPESAINPSVPAAPEQLRQELHHCHLPLLADLEFVEWERDPFVATRGSKFGEIAAVLEAIESSATELPDSLVVGCQRLEREREQELAVDE